MSRITRHRDAPYWTHSDPTPPTGEERAPSPLPTVEQLRTLARNCCPGACNKAWRDRDWSGLAIAELAKPEPDERVVRRGIPKPAEPIWCRACAENIRVGTGRLPDLAAACGARRDGQLAPPPKAERHGTVVAPPSPSPGWDQVEDIVAWAEAWTATTAEYIATRNRSFSIATGWKLYASNGVHVAEVAQYLPTGIPGRTLTRWAGYLQGHMTAVLSAPFARDYGIELQDLVHRAEKVSGTDDLVHPLPLVCLQCDRKLLVRRDGKDEIRCRGCKASWTEAAYERLSAAYRVQERRKA